jgi:predicted DNA-binding protein
MKDRNEAPLGRKSIHSNHECDMVRVKVRLPSELMERLEAAAEQLGMSCSQVARIAITSVIEATDDDYGPLGNGGER